MREGSDKLRKGICLTALYPQAMVQVQLLVELFYKVKNTGIFNCVEFYFQGEEEDEVKIGQVLHELGLSSVFLAGYFMKKEKIDISAQEEEKRRSSVEKCKELYSHACRMKTDKMLILSGPAWEKKNRKFIISQTRKSLLELGEQQILNGPEITLEYFNTWGEPWLAVGDVAMVKEIFEGKPDLKVGITFDTSHTAQMNADIKKAFVDLLPWVRHIHLANSVSTDKGSPLFGDKHPLFSIEHGDFTLKSIKNFYKDLKKTGVLKRIDICSFEVISRGQEDRFFEELCKEAKFVWE